MNPELIPQLIAEIALADARVRRDDKTERRAQAKMWAGILAEVPYDFALQAAHQHYRTSQWPIMPADIATRWHAQSRDRLGRHTDPIPNADPDDPEAWRRQLAQTRRAVAQGHIEPATHAVAAGPPADIPALTAGIGRTVPDRDEKRPYIHADAAKALAACRPKRTAREAARRSGSLDLLSVACPWCGAPANEQCKRRRTARAGSDGTWFRRDQPHPGRADAAAIAAHSCPACAAPVGAPCITADGQPHTGIHPSRAASTAA